MHCTYFKPLVPGGSKEQNLPPKAVVCFKYVWPFVSNWHESFKGEAVKEKHCCEFLIFETLIQANVGLLS